jgi:hypothetical protein
MFPSSRFEYIMHAYHKFCASRATSGKSHWGSNFSNGSHRPGLSPAIRNISILWRPVAGSIELYLRGNALRLIYNWSVICWRVAVNAGSGRDPGERSIPRRCSSWFAQGMFSASEIDVLGCCTCNRRCFFFHVEAFYMLHDCLASQLLIILRSMYLPWGPADLICSIIVHTNQMA